jgi:hypothetical protein
MSNTTAPPKAAVQPRRKWLEQYRLEIFIFACGLIALNLIFFARAFREGTTIDRTAAGQLGDFVGGYIGTYFALVTVVLVIRTIREQRRADRREKFENKYYELIKLHRDNVAELKLGSATGRRIFVLLRAELRFILEMVGRIGEQTRQKLSQRERLHVGYYCLFYGVGPNSSRMLNNGLAKFDKAFLQTLTSELARSVDDAQKQLHLKYKPFDGNQSRLGHYYRHLYQTVSYIHRAPDLDPDEKYEYVKTVRAQLSTHEQALLLMNSLTPIGQAWWRDDLIWTYCLVKNVPRDFFDSSAEIDIAPLFRPGYFEWEEVKNETYLPADVTQPSEAAARQG